MAGLLSWGLCAVAVCTQQDYTAEQLDLWQEVLDEENPDLFKVLTHQLPQPERLTANPVFLELQRWVDSKS
eukprot:SAG22_NODE_6114_length_896_cov_2.942284_3_plen_70_part_01